MAEQQKSLKEPKVVQFPKKTNNQDNPNIFCLLLRIPDILQWLVPLTGLQTHLLLHLAANGLRRISSLYSLGLVASGGPNNNGQRNSKSNLTRNQQPTLSKLMKAPQSSICNMYQKKRGEKMWKQKQPLQLHEHDLHFHLQSCANSSRDSMPSWFTSKTSNNSSAWTKKSNGWSPKSRHLKQTQRLSFIGSPYKSGKHKPTSYLLCSSRIECSSFQCEHQNLWIVQPKFPTRKKATGNIHLQTWWIFPFATFAYPIFQKTSELQLLQPVDGRFLVLPFQHTKGELYIWYLRQVSVVDFWTCQLAWERLPARWFKPWPNSISPIWACHPCSL